jgi:DNA-binding NarL/FixJ family response regulator
MLLRPINLAISGNHALFRSALKSFLSEEQNIRVVLQVQEIFELLIKLKSVSIDILLMDIFLPEWNGFDALKGIRSEYPELKILVLSINSDIDLVTNLLNCGIHGYVSKTDEPAELLEAIRAVANNQIYRNGMYTEALYRRKQNGIRIYPGETPVVLNERERKMLQLIWEEKSNKEIADELFLGVRSIEKIRQDIKEKIGARSTVGLLKYAINKKIIGVGAKVGTKEELDKY